jgi:hypothetical protein
VCQGLADADREGSLGKWQQGTCDRPVEDGRGGVSACGGWRSVFSPATMKTFLSFSGLPSHVSSSGNSLEGDGEREIETHSSPAARNSMPNHACRWGSPCLGCIRPLPKGRNALCLSASRTCPRLHIFADLQSPQNATQLPKIPPPPPLHLTCSPVPLFSSFLSLSPSLPLSLSPSPPPHLLFNDRDGGGRERTRREDKRHRTDSPVGAPFTPFPPSLPLFPPLSLSLYLLPLCDSDLPENQPRPLQHGHLHPFLEASLASSTASPYSACDGTIVPAISLSPCSPLQEHCGDGQLGMRS